MSTAAIAGASTVIIYRSQFEAAQDQAAMALFGSAEFFTVLVGFGVATMVYAAAQVAMERGSKRERDTVATLIAAAVGFAMSAWMWSKL